MESSMTTLTTRIFKNGNSQAVRIPQEFRLDINEVEISRSANGDLIIHPIPLDRGAALMTALNGFDNEFASQLEQDYRQQALMQDREAL
jgi:antitoxin VapB